MMYKFFMSTQLDRSSLLSSIWPNYFLKVLHIYLANFFTSIELSQDDKVVFVGGGENSPGEKGIAYLAALDTTNRYSLLQFAKYPASTNYDLVSVVRRH